MAISSPNPEVDRPVKAQDRIGNGRSPYPLGHVAGRLAPLALDNAQRKHDAMLYSVAVGGLTREQINEVSFVGPVALGRLRAAIRTVVSRWR